MDSSRPLNIQMSVRACLSHVGMAPPRTLTPLEQLCQKFCRRAVFSMKNKETEAIFLQNGPSYLPNTPLFSLLVTLSLAQRGF
jgi:hypothetical protein